MSAVQTPDCPQCGNPPALAISAAQAFCDTDGCPVLTWDMRDTAAEHWARLEVIDLSGGGNDGAVSTGG